MQIKIAAPNSFSARAAPGPAPQLPLSDERGYGDTAFLFPTLSRPTAYDVSLSVPCLDASPPPRHTVTLTTKQWKKDM